MPSGWALPLESQAFHLLATQGGDRATVAAALRALTTDRPSPTHEALASLCVRALSLSEPPHEPAVKHVPWAANKRFKKFPEFKFKFPRARNFEIIGLVLGCIEAKFCK